MNKYYENKGYIMGKIGTPVEVKVEDLSPNSNANVVVQCDFCGKIYTMKYCKYLSTKDSGNCCKDCVPKKSEQTMIEKYGVSNTSKLDSVKEKRAQTCFIRYGAKTNLCTEENKEKSKVTCREKYGVDYPAQNEEVKEKMRKTNLERFGYDVAMKSEAVKIKVRNTLYQNGTCPSSTQQRYIQSVVGGVLNSPVGPYNIDILIDDNIAIEYNGSGHDLQVRFKNMSREEFNQKERRRTEYLISKGYKIIFLNSKKDKIPKPEILITIIEKAKNELSNKNIITIDLDKIE